MNCLYNYVQEMSEFKCIHLANFIVSILTCVEIAFICGDQLFLKNMVKWCLEQEGVVIALRDSEI